MGVCFGCHGDRYSKIVTQVKNVKNPASQLSSGLLLQASLKFQLEYVVPIQTTYAAENGNSPNSKLVRIFIRKTPCGKLLCSTLNETPKLRPDDVHPIPGQRIWEIFYSHSDCCGSHPRVNDG